MEQVFNSLSKGQTFMVLRNDKIEINPIPFVHFSMKNFVDDIDLKIIKEKLDVHILYEGYKPNRFGGTNTTAIYQSFNLNGHSDIVQIILLNVEKELLIRGLEFKCVIKCTITF
jgi:hypothetical protein